jgi:hypothetical protein
MASTNIGQQSKKQEKKEIPGRDANQPDKKGRKGGRKEGRKETKIGGGSKLLLRGF